MGPLVAPLDEATAKFALPPYTGPTHPSKPEVVPAKKTGDGSAIQNNKAATAGMNAEVSSIDA